MNQSQMEAFFNCLAARDYDPIDLENFYYEYQLAQRHSDTELCRQIYRSIQHHLQELKAQGTLDDDEILQYMNNLAL